MLKDALKLPDDPQELKSVAVQLATTVKSQALEIERLKHQLAGQLRHRFGAKSEASDQLNLQLRLEEEETAAAQATTPTIEDASEPKEKPKRKPLPSTLPRIEEVLTPGDACACGGAPCHRCGLAEPRLGPWRGDSPRRARKKHPRDA